MELVDDTGRRLGRADRMVAAGQLGERVGDAVADRAGRNARSAARRCFRVNARFQRPDVVRRRQSDDSCVTSRATTACRAISRPTFPLVEPGAGDGNRTRVASLEGSELGFSDASTSNYKLPGASSGALELHLATHVRATSGSRPRPVESPQHTAPATVRTSRQSGLRRHRDHAIRSQTGILCPDGRRALRGLGTHRLSRRPRP